MTKYIGWLINLKQSTVFHTIRKIIKKSSVTYFCNECNTHYSRLKWLKDDHPGINPDTFTVHDLKKEGI